MFCKEMSLGAIWSQKNVHMESVLYEYEKPHSLTLLSPFSKELLAMQFPIRWAIRHGTTSI